MPSKNFTDFNLKTLPLSGDFIVGYNSDGSAEFRLTIDSLFKYINAQLTLATTTTTTTVAPTTTTTVAPTTTTTVAPTTTTTVAPIVPTVNNHLFTSSSIPIDITNIISGINPTITLKLNTNYDLNINTSVPVAIRVAPDNGYTEIPEIYNNKLIAGVTNTTLMFTPTSLNTLYYVSAINASHYGLITII